MALIYVPQYELKFDTLTGQDINWEIDILRSYDDGSPTPSWASNPVQSLIGTDDPIEIEYERDYDVYKPIQGSTATLNLVVTSQGQYDDFSNGNPYEYQLRLRYRDASNVLQDYWCGLFSPLDSKEDVTTFPFGISFTAVDGLGLLEQSTPERSNDDSDVNAFATFIVPALVQTGLGLPIYVQSGIQLADNSEALTTATVSNFARWKDLDDLGELFTHKELLEGYLSAFNCKITQANGNWYIYNGSTLKDSTNWKVFNTQGVSQADVTESLLLTVDGSSNQSLIPSENNLQLNLRRPNGSVECNPKDLVERQFAANGNFEDDLSGWTFTGSSSQGAITGSSGSKKFTLYQNYFSSNTLFNTPALSSTNGYAVDPEADIEVSFDWIPEKIGNDSVELLWQVTARFDSIAIPTVQPPDFSAPDPDYALERRNWDYKAPGLNTTSLIWSEYGNQWVTGSHRTDGTHIKQSATTVNEVLNVSKTFRNPTTFRNEFGGADIQNLRFDIHFFWLVSRDGGDRNGASTSLVRASIDNVSVKNMFANDVLSPTFERVQESFTTTQSYEPLFASSISNALYQKLTPETYKRLGVTETKTLEELGTQYKLNDFHEQFRYYEGSFINNSSTPLTNINKIRLNWNNYSESVGGIMNGGTFRPRYNSFDTSFYIPNQSTDIAPHGYDNTSGYSEVNVDLRPATFPGRSTQVVYTLALRVDTVDDNGVAVANGLVPSVPFVQVTGAPGQIINEKIDLIPLTGYVGIPSGTSIADDSDDTPIPEYTATGSFLYVQGNITLPLQITLPEESEFEELFINAEAIAFTPEATPGVVVGSLAITNNIPNSSPTSITIPVSGVPGDRKSVTVNIEANDTDNDGTPDYTFQNLDSTDADDDLTFVTATGNGTSSGTFTYNYEVPTTGESISATLTGSTIANTVDPSQIRTRNLVITNNSNSLVSISDGTTSGNVTTIPFVGVAGTSTTRNVTFIPVSGREVNSIAASGLSSGISVDTGAGTGDEFELPVTISFEGAAATADLAMTVNATTSVEPYSVTFNVNSLNVEGAHIGLSQGAGGTLTGNNGIVFPYSQADIDSSDSIDSFTVTLTPNEGMMFENVNQADIDVVEGSVLTASGDTIDLGESAFTAARQPNLGPNGEITWIIEGNLPSPGGNYIVTINAVGGLGSGSASTIVAPATDLAIEFLGPDVPANGGTALFQVTANGTWTTEVMATSQGQSVVSTDGSFSGTYTSNNHTISISGAYGPISGTSGVTIIEVSMDALTLGGFQDSGVFQTFSGASLSVEAISPDALPNRIAVGNQLTSTGNINVMLDGVSDTRALTYSANYPNLTFYN